MVQEIKHVLKIDQMKEKGKGSSSGAQTMEPLPPSSLLSPNLTSIARINRERTDKEPPGTDGPSTQQQQQPVTDPAPTQSTPRQGGNSGAESQETRNEGREIDSGGRQPSNSEETADKGDNLHVLSNIMNKLPLPSKSGSRGVTKEIHTSENAVLAKLDDVTAVLCSLA